MKRIGQLQLMARRLIIESLKSTTEGSSGHPTFCMSAAEIVSVLFSSELREDDGFILSKGRAAPIPRAACADAGYVSEEDLSTLRRIDGILEGHPTVRMLLVRVAASIRNACQTREAALVGADIATLPLYAIRDLLGHHKTREGVATFTRDVVPEYIDLTKG